MVVITTFWFFLLLNFINEIVFTQFSGLYHFNFDLLFTRIDLLPDFDEFIFCKCWLNTIVGSKLDASLFRDSIKIERNTCEYFPSDKLKLFEL